MAEHQVVEIIGEFYWLSGEWWEHDGLERKWFVVAGEYDEAVYPVAN